MEVTASIDRDPATDPLGFDWNGVRPVYRQMHQEFAQLTSPFGIRLSKTLNQALAVLIAAMDAVDRELDSIHLVKERTDYSNQVIDFLAEQHVGSAMAPGTEEARFRLRALRDCLVSADIQKPFCQTLQRIFFHAESKRQSREHQCVVKHLLAEWRCAGELPILLMGQQSNSQFERFFASCCEAMMVVDTMLDAKADYLSGQLMVCPGWAFYGRLAGVFLVRLPVLVWLFPSRLQLLRYFFVSLRCACKADSPKIATATR